MKHEQIELELEQRNMCFVCHGQLDEQGDCPVCCDPETYRTQEDIVADENVLKKMKSSDLMQTKICKDCGNTYPVDYKHWRWKDYGYAIKPLPRCFCASYFRWHSLQRECRTKKHQQNKHATLINTNPNRRTLL